MNEDRVRFEKKPMRVTQRRRGHTSQRVVEPGNGTRYWIIAGEDGNGVPFVALPDFGVAATMSYDGYTAPSYVSEKLGKGLTAADCEIVAEIINDWWEND